MKRTSIALALFALAFGAQAQDVEAGKKKVAEVCAACHGPEGNSASGDFPRVAGQHKDYIAKALRDYKSGARKDPVMAGFANALSPQDITNVAAYFSSQTGLQSKY